MPPAFENPILVWFLLTVALAVLGHLFLRKELRVRGTLYGSFLLACVVSLWPPYDTADRPGRLRLGLDLRGGMHLVLQVVTDDALRATLDDAIQQTRTEVLRKGVPIGSSGRIDTAAFFIDGIGAARTKDVQDVLDRFFRNNWIVAEPSEGRFEVRMTDTYVRQLERETLREAMRTLERRVNELGVAEPVIAEHGDRGDQILVQLPGVTDAEQAKRVLKRTAQLSLKIVESSASTREALLPPDGNVPNGIEIIEGLPDGTSGPIFYSVKREAVITGRDLKNARASVDQFNRPNVSFTLNPAGAEKFRRATRENIGSQLAVILDGRVETAPVIQGEISTEGQITGSYTVDEADELSRVLRAGALPASLRTLQERSVGASLGRDSIRAGVTASAAGLIFILAFMLFYYKLSGINAAVALIANLLILLGAMAYTQATLTLPGIAGVILTVGVGVDTNVLIFERIREELRNGKTVRSAINNGFERVWITILDTHTTGLIAAVLLFQFGTGPIKGFAVTLSIGLLANIFASFFLSRFLFEWMLGKRPAEQLSI